MGCDIHGTIEVRPIKDWHWTVVANIADMSPRNYRLFSYLFGVRGPKGHFDNRGLPPDVCWYTKWAWTGYNNGDEKDRDYHSTSYVTWNELKPHIPLLREELAGYEEWLLVLDMMEWLAKRYETVYDNVIESTAVPALTEGANDTSKVRLIVWFDD